MTELVKNLLTQYYGLGAESSGKKFLSVHESVETVKNEEDKQITEQTSLTTNEDNVSEEESQIKDNDDGRKLSVASESYRRSSLAFDNMEDAYDTDEDLDLFKDIHLGSNVLYDIFENTKNEQSSNVAETCVTPTLDTPGVLGHDLKEPDRNDLSLSLTEDTSANSCSEFSSATLRKSQKSWKIGTPLLPVSKKEPICNEMFADFSNIDLKQFPDEILSKYLGLRMLYIADNRLAELPEEIFKCLKQLEWLDARNNELTTLPISIESHPCLETLLLQGNRMENLPLELCTLPKLKTLQVTQNPLITPPKNVVTLGFSAILEFLRNEWNNVHPDHQVKVKKNKIEPKLSTILCYQSPRRKKKTTPSKSTVRDNNSFPREKRKTYKPSNRYPHENSIFVTNKNNLLVKKKSDSLCDYCQQNLIDRKTDKKPNSPCEDAGNARLKIVNDRKDKVADHIDSEIDEINGKILRLMGPSPRSLYVRQNVKTLRTFRKSMIKECRIKSSVKGLNSLAHLQTQNRFSAMDTE